MGSGADVNAPDDSGDTPLLYRLRHSNGDLDVVKVLLENGANPNAEAKDGSTPLILAARAYIAGNGQKANYEFWSSIAALLIRGGADVNAKDKAGATALSVATSNDQGRSLAQLLIEAGAK